MALLSQRKETEREIIIIFKYQIIWYLSFIAVFLLSFLDIESKWQMIIFLIFIIVTIIWIIDNISLNIEIRRAMKKGKVEISGSKFSYKNPLTIRIKKNENEKESN